LPPNDLRKPSRRRWTRVGPDRRVLSFHARRKAATGKEVVPSASRSPNVTARGSSAPTHTAGRWSPAKRKGPSSKERLGACRVRSSTVSENDLQVRTSQPRRRKDRECGAGLKNPDFQRVHGQTTRALEARRTLIGEALGATVGCPTGDGVRRWGDPPFNRARYESGPLRVWAATPFVARVRWAAGPAGEFSRGRPAEGADRAWLRQEPEFEGREVFFFFLHQRRGCERDWRALVRRTKCGRRGVSGRPAIAKRNQFEQPAPPAVERANSPITGTPMGAGREVPHETARGDPADQGVTIGVVPQRPSGEVVGAGAQSTGRAMKRRRGKHNQQRAGPWF